MKKLGLLLLSLTTVICLVGCNGNVIVEDEENKLTNSTETNMSGTNINESNTSNDVNQEVKLETNDKYASVENNPVVTMEMESGDIVKIELYPQVAPTTVENFIDLIEKGYYDGLTFHRLIPSFMAQGGDPLGNGMGGPGYTIKGEFNENGFKNDITHEIGVISMARTQDPNGGGSQFFIVTDEASYLSLDGKYAGFGKVIEGMDAVYTIVNTKVHRTAIDDDVMMAAYTASMEIQSTGSMTDENQKALDAYYAQQAELDRPINPPVIKKMTVETFGVEYDEPEKIAE